MYPRQRFVLKLHKNNSLDNRIHKLVLLSAVCSRRAFVSLNNRLSFVLLKEEWSRLFGRKNISPYERGKDNLHSCLTVTESLRVFFGRRLHGVKTRHDSRNTETGCKQIARF